MVAIGLLGCWWKVAFACLLLMLVSLTGCWPETVRDQSTPNQAQHATGNTVIIDHGLNLFTSYSHLDQLLVQPGATVNKGDVIGKVGSTGFSTGPHLHWTVSIGLVFVNPWLFLEQDPLAGNSGHTSAPSVKVITGEQQ